MKYLSTRGDSPQLGFSDILLGGLMQDGGLSLPAEYPRITDAELTAMRSMSYAELAFTILSKFATDIPVEDLRALTAKTYTAQVYCNGRPDSDASQITPLRKLENNLFLQELSNGPTLAFKDMAMQLLGNLFEYVLAKRGEEINILGATSGDTGSAAEYAMRGKHGVRVFMLSPRENMSAFQRAQMYSLQDANIFNIAVRGMFDDAQDIVKAVSNDLAFKAQYKIGAVNSINWGRVAAQVIYYFKGWLSATTGNDQEVSFAVPSGNFGNICAGHIVRQMGLPIRKLILATNENDVLDEFFRTGAYKPRKTVDVKVTSSPSMDISKASNFERFVYDLVGRDPKVVAELWRAVDGGGQFDLAGTQFWARIKDFGFVSGASSHADRLATIRRVYKDHGLMIDTHTADGLKVALEHRDTDIPTIVLETALPAKFEETIIEALGEKPWRPTSMQNIEALPQRVEVMDIDVQAVKDFIAARSGG
ncbi:MAG: threonine synthase [Candidatus Dactylopiibacterium carminicum]|uniref:Threonine synthase n=1 Tax=Candidatus Dactylopiibacterium carminicum TaxID=857335 RepID=A0A272ETL4_9RHOO|nr:threonine synthase [Candidatus Dactylopiibacterium carminicum]KAF7599059.1 threonine synthase [Candidatus Dactylopiibacterium carminicum]PAS93090.1 MAG: threonine synthase [Candidatus Dactylopiibacterium carminicum]PAS99072.1 MAG: threonine synthase [Candidatus Dactylopiibacterium carminicum]